MEQLLEQLKGDNHQKSTKLNYYGIWKNFNLFIIKLDKIPNTWEKRISLYCIYLVVDQELKSSTIKSYISGIKSVLKSDGYICDEGKLLLNALIKSCKLKNDTIKTRLPIQKGLLEIILFEIRRRFGTQPYLEAMYISAYLIAYYGLLRVGEITFSIHSVKAKDLHESKTKKRLLLVLYSSKTHGRESLPQQVKIFGKTELEVTDKNKKSRYAVRQVKPTIFCPYDWTRKYIQMRQKIQRDDEQIFVFRDGTPLQAQHLRKLLKETLKHLELDPNLYDTHSFRIGRATDLFKAGVDIKKIKQLGRWKSNAVYKYLRAG